jgi:hypothetical protein
LAECGLEAKTERWVRSTTIQKASHFNHQAVETEHAWSRVSNGEFNQAELVKILGAPCDTRELAGALGPPWKGTGVPENELDKLLGQGPWAAEFRELQPTVQYKRLEAAHTVVVDGLDEQGNIMIRDPADGKRYEMTRKDFVKHWTLHSVFRN